MLFVMAVVLGSGPGADPRPPNKADLETGPLGSGSAVAVPAARGPLTLEADYRRGIARVLPSVVQITSQSGKEISEGSGIVYDTLGHIVTNAHVVGDAKRFEVMLATGGAPRTARLVGTYKPGDLAVIKVDDASGLVPTGFGNSDQLAIGQIVLAMGNPLGLSGSVTDGIVSGLNRTVQFSAEGHETVAPTATGLIQTSAAINPGNSGGALVDLAGQVVGVLVADLVSVETGSVLPGIGFAIPSNTVSRVVRQLVEKGEVTDADQAGLGVMAQTVVDRHGRPTGVGVMRTAQEPGRGGGTQTALRPGNVIVALDDTPVLTAQDLARALAAHRPGDSAKVELLNPDGSTTTTTVRLGTSRGD
ncbi:S1-C subfamily serine protease [Streptosporangium saharense]|uniref:S1-C subfamily serine protease n=2 Tax=Streptosporangium saharense TaxID=1706840 RepID=A0A7W7VP35_9ACTN|nr:S1-C subfamily serine protease [Streptosporangium saharense]